MIRTLSRLIVRAAELAEAEGRLARVQVMRLMRLAAVMSVSVVGVSAGLLTIGAGVTIALMRVMSPGAALIIVGLGLVVISGGAASMVREREAPSPPYPSGASKHGGDDES